VWPRILPHVDVTCTTHGFEFGHGIGHVWDIAMSIATDITTDIATDIITDITTAYWWNDLPDEIITATSFCGMFNVLIVLCS